MNKILFILILCSLFNPEINSQWVQQNSGTSNSLNTIHFFDLNTGFSAGINSVILKTTNGGNNWITVTSPVNMSFDYVRVFSTNNVIIGSVSSYSVLRTNNGGINWTYTTINIPSSESKKKVQFVSYTHGFFLTGTNLYKTIDAGMTWSSISTNVANRDMSFANENTGWICNQYTIPYPPPYGTNYSQVRRTDNGGQNWTVQINIQEQSFAIYRVFFYDVNLGFNNAFFTYSISRTGNGGSSWSVVNGAGLYKNYYQMSFSNGTIGWFIGDIMIKTTNSGLDWIERTTQFGNQFNNIFFLNDTVGWLVGSAGLILKTTNGGEPMIGVDPVLGQFPSFPSLSQNCPNPFNPVTKIKYQIPAVGQRHSASGGFDVRLIIYDILGREIETLVNETQKPGSYEVDWDGSRYASGVYFYRLYIDDASTPLSITKKMVLIK